MPDPRPCCILGVCCPPGGKEQRKDLKQWLLDKLLQKEMPGALYGPGNQPEKLVDSWLDELFAAEET